VNSTPSSDSYLPSLSSPWRTLTINHNMLFGVYFLLLISTGIGGYPILCVHVCVVPVVDRYFVPAPNPLRLTISTIDVSAICLGHAVVNTGPPVALDAQPTRMRHLCKNMQKAVQNTATRLLTIIRFSGPSLSNTAPVPGGRLSRIHFCLSQDHLCPRDPSCCCIRGGRFSRWTST